MEAKKLYAENSERRIKPLECKRTGTLARRLSIVV